MISKIYILYTGGTFGMRPNDSGSLVPSKWDEILTYLPAIKDNQYFSQFRNIEYTFETLDEILDSSSITPQVWSSIANKVKENYDSHDGFVIIHGTDTMAYSASALSFVLQGLNKPIVLTGAQLPIFHPRTDGITNLTNAIFIAGYKSFDLKRIPEVCICFSDDLLRGNRAVKTSTNDFEGFSSPNFPNLGHLEQHISISEGLVNSPGAGLDIKDKFSEKVVNVTIFPGYNPTALIELVNAKKIEGIVLRTFGAGNIPKIPIWSDLIASCEKNEIVILATTQCPNGQIELGQYSASEVLKSEVVIDGLDITPEAALTKLMWAIGNYNFTDRIKVLRQNLQGEISTPN